MPVVVSDGGPIQKWRTTAADRPRSGERTGEG